MSAPSDVCVCGHMLRQHSASGNHECISCFAFAGRDGGLVCTKFRPVEPVMTEADIPLRADGQRHISIDLTAEHWSYVADALDRFAERYDAGDYELMHGGTQLGSAMAAIRDAISPRSGGVPQPVNEEPE